ncbi:MAG: hypothetical protein QXU18_05695 [Thermoplasmatales archaeon]
MLDDENIPLYMMKVISFRPADLSISTVFFTVVTSTTVLGYIIEYGY